LDRQAFDWTEAHVAADNKAILRGLQRELR
jgi:hypothetical protein